MAQTLNAAEYLAAVDQLIIMREISLGRLNDLRDANNQTGIQRPSLDKTIEIASAAVLRLMARRAKNQFGKMMNFRP
jgi:hypothetical protein